MFKISREYHNIGEGNMQEIKEKGAKLNDPDKFKLNANMYIVFD